MSRIYTVQLGAPLEASVHTFQTSFLYSARVSVKKSPLRKNNQRKHEQTGVLPKPETQTRPNVGNIDLNVKCIRHVYNRSQEANLRNYFYL